MHHVKKMKGSSSNFIPIVVFDFWLLDVGPISVGFDTKGFAVEPERVRAVLVETPSFVGEFFDEGEASEMVFYAAAHFDDIW